MKTWLTIGLIALLAALSALGGCSAEETSVPVLRFSAIPDEKDVTAFEQKFGRVAEHLSKELGVPVEYVHATSYANAVELFTKGEVQLAWFGGLSGVQARHKVPGARAIAQGSADPNFYSYFIANASTGLERGEDFPMGIEGRRFTFGSKGSTSGRLLPESFIREHLGKAPAEAFSAVNFSGAHDQTCKLVAAGEWEVGATNYKTYDKLVEAGEIDPEVCRVIWQTPTYADYNFTAHPDLEKEYGAGFIDKLQKAVLGMKDPALLKAFDRDELIAARNEDYEAIHGLAQQLGFLN